MKKMIELFFFFFFWWIMENVFGRCKWATFMKYLFASVNLRDMT